jgi:hypothetical protein
MDGQSVKTTEHGGTRGFDGYKPSKAKGSERAEKNLLLICGPPPTVGQYRFSGLFEVRKRTTAFAVRRRFLGKR